MKKIICEVCGGREFIKENGVFLCQNCGAKYSLEEARKIMTEVDDEPKQPMPANESDGTNDVYSENKNTSGKKSRKKIIIIAIVAVALVAAAIAVFSTLSSSKCGVQECNEKKMENSDYCAEHTCHADGCYNKAENGEYCVEHTCSYEGCANPVLNSAYCEEHTCKVDGCSEGTIGESSYCVVHKCKESKCKNKSSLDGYCKKHALKNSGLPQCLIDYAKYYGESAKDILENYKYAGVADIPGSDFNGYKLYTRNGSPGYYLVEDKSPYRIYYAEAEGGAAFLMWENGAPGVDEGI